MWRLPSIGNIPKDMLYVISSVYNRHRSSTLTLPPVGDCYSLSDVDTNQVS